jgi:mannose-1-phosphate guanylyltransferase
MLQETVSRLEPILGRDDVYVVCSERYVADVVSQLEPFPEDQIIVEPLARSTAACAGLAACYLKQQFPEEMIVMLPADHVMRDIDEFHDTLRAGEELGREGWLVTFGIEPSHPATGYGYMLQGDLLGDFGGRPAYKVKRFTEKPDRSTAEQFLKKGTYHWNSGMFLFSIERILSEIDLRMPLLGQALSEIEQNWDDPDRMKEIFSSLESVSIDFGIMEKSERIALLPSNPGWSDVGSWKALEVVLDADVQGVTSNTPHVNIDSHDCVLYTAGGKLVALVGVGELVVVDTEDALLVCARDRTEEVRKVIESLKEMDLKDYI